MSDRYIFIPSWERHQHYKDKTRPPWIKLHVSLLHDDEWLNLTEGQRSALIGIWLLYASTARHLTANTASLSRQLGQRVSSRTLNALNEAGFIEFRSREALEQVYARSRSRSREEVSIRDQRAKPAETAERESQQGKSNGWVDNLSSYTGCRYVRGEFALTAVFDVLGTEPPPKDWPYERPSRDEIRKALEEVVVA